MFSHSFTLAKHDSAVCFAVNVTKHKVSISEEKSKNTFLNQFSIFYRLTLFIGIYLCDFSRKKF